MKPKSWTLTLIFLIFTNCVKIGNKTESNSQEWQLIYKTDPAGNTVFGSKEKLMAIIRRGCPIRIGWSSRRGSDTTKTVEHVVDGKFLTIANGKEVFVQIQPFLAQRPNLTSDTLSMALLPIESHWVLGTNGTISSASINFSKNTGQSSPPSPFRYEMSWFAKTP